jgi:putative flippase GtrA/glycosyltransferase involved in cell wall biosynthesis
MSLKHPQQFLETEEVFAEASPPETTMSESLLTKRTPRKTHAAASVMKRRRRISGQMSTDSPDDLAEQISAQPTAEVALIADPVENGGELEREGTPTGAVGTGLAPVRMSVGDMLRPVLPPTSGQGQALSLPYVGEVAPLSVVANGSPSWEYAAPQGILQDASSYDRPRTAFPSIRSTPTWRILSLLPKRVMGFSFVGGGVMVGGMLLLFVLIQLLHMEPHLAYLVQAVASIETNFFLNRFLNWKDRDGNLLAQWIKFHSTTLVTFPLNQALFALLTWLGLHYLVITLLGAGVAAVVNYLSNDRFVFHKSTCRIDGFTTGGRHVRTPLPLYPRVGVIIPVRNSQRTIRQCVQSVLQQQYPGSFKIFLVGNTPNEDATWQALGELAQHPAVHCIQVKRPYGWTGRDANLKRYSGCKMAIAADAEVIAFLDSQVTAPPDWLAQAMMLLHKHQTDGIAGKSACRRDDKTLVSLYQDRSLFSEWPTYGSGFVLSQASIGRARGLPITGNLFITRQVWESMQDHWPLQVTYSWEDFRLVWQIVSAGYTFFCTDSLCVTRHHKPKFRLVKHFAAGAGAVEFHQTSADCPYVKNRLFKAGIVTFSAALFLGLLVVACVLSQWLALALLTGSLVSAMFVLGILSTIKARDIRGLLFPWLDLLHIGLWILGASYVTWMQEPQQKKALAELLVALR